MLLETLKEETEGIHAGDELMKTLNEIAQNSASEGPMMDPTLKSSIEKTEKDKLNTKERRSSRSVRFQEKEALQCRSSSVKRAMHNILEHSKQLKPRPDKRYSMQVDNLCVFTSSSSDTSPWSSPVPPINIISPSVSTTQLTCLSPLPDLRRDSMDDYFFSSLNIPAPKQFADNSRRSSGVPESIQEQEENGGNGNNEAHKDLKATINITTIADSSVACRLGYLAYSETEQRDDGFGFMPYEVYERNQLRNQQNVDSTTKCTRKIESNSSSSNNTLQIPNIAIPDLEIQRPPPPSGQPSTPPPRSNNVYISDNITLIDTDQPVSKTFLKKSLV